MAVSTLAFIKEKVRQKTMKDSNFLKKMTYFFELKIPKSLGIGPSQTISMMFPLIIPPESYSMDEPFAAEVTKTQGGGIFVEENGIVERPIRLRGTTGFMPRQLKTMGPLSIAGTAQPSYKSFSRELPPVAMAIAKISGHKHFQYLQDTVFRAYADLKRDPATSEDTKLIFHNPKDDEHWVVIPQRFSLSRTAPKDRVLYRYNIELLAIDKAESVNADFSEDKNILDNLKDAMRTIKRGVDMGTGALDDLTAMQAEVKSYISNIGVILDSVTTLLNAASAFLDGTTELVEAPYAFLESTIELVDAALGVAVSASELEEASVLPDHTVQRIRHLNDSLELLGTNPAQWETPTEATIRKLKEQQEGRRWASRVRREEAALTEAPTTFAEQAALGTALTPGDVTSMDGELSIGGETNKFRSMRSVAVTQGDTLASLAAQYMGDARLWQYIATANGLKPPFVDNQASKPLTPSGADELPFVQSLGIGGKIAIPTNLNSALDYPLLPVLGVKVSESLEAQLLGTDVQLKAVGGIAGSSRVLYDVPIDVAGGSVDVKIVSGVANLKQFMLTRVITEQGSDLLYTRVGIQRIIGLGFTDSDLENARFRVVESVVADPRIVGVRNVEFVQNEDKYEIDLEAVVRGFAETRSIQAEI